MCLGSVKIGETLKQSFELNAADGACHGLSCVAPLGPLGGSLSLLAIDLFFACCISEVNVCRVKFHSCIQTPPIPAGADHRPPHAARGLPAQRGVHPHAPHGRAPHRRTNAVQSRRETLPRALLRHQAQLVSVGGRFFTHGSGTPPAGLIVSWPQTSHCASLERLVGILRK